MISTYAIINSSNIVTDINMWDGNTSTWSPASGFIAVGIGSEYVGIGMTYNSGGVGVGSTSANKWISS
mgnify:FL=1